VLDGLCPERGVRDERGAGQRGVHVAAPDDRQRHEVAAVVEARRIGSQRGEWVGDGFEYLIVDLDERRGLPGCLACLGGDGGQHVAHVARRLTLADEQRPVIDDEALASLAGHVAPGHHGDDAGQGRGPCGADPPDERPGMVGEADGPVEHPGCSQVVDERSLTEGELARLVSGGP